MNPLRGQARPEVVSEHITRKRAGWIELAGSADHKAIGKMWIATSLLFAAVAITEFVMMRLQLLLPDSTFMRPEIFDRLASTYGMTALVLAIIPLGIGIISYVTPLQLGARGMALPRVHALSYWLFLFGGVTIYLSFLYRPSEAGTIALPPLSDDFFLPNRGVDAWIAGVSLAILAFVLFAVSLIATYRSNRAPGLVWRRVPIFSSAAVIVSYTLLVVGSIMLAALAMLTVDRHFSGVFFDPVEGGAPLLYQHLSSIFLAGGYISVVILAFGAISEILPTFSRQPHFGHRAISGSLATLAVLGVLAWPQNMYGAPMPLGVSYFAMFMACAAVVPVGLILFNWFATLSGGAIRMRAPMLFALGAIFFTVFGLAGELAQSIVPVGWLLTDTATALGDTYLALIGAGVLGLFAALHYWFPKINGRMMGESLGKASFVLIALGTLAYVIPTQLAGLEGMAVDVFKYYGDSGMTAYNVIATIGGVIFALGVLLTLINAAASHNNGTRVGADPWGGTTLEWFAPSPPPIHNFDLVPDVRSLEPLRDIRTAIRRRTTRREMPPAVIPGREPERVPAGTGARTEGSGTPATSGRIGDADSDVGSDQPSTGDEGGRPVA